MINDTELSLVNIKSSKKEILKSLTQLTKTRSFKILLNICRYGNVNSFGPDFILIKVSINFFLSSISIFNCLLSSSFFLVFCQIHHKFLYIKIYMHKNIFGWSNK